MACMIGLVGFGFSQGLQKGSPWPKMQGGITNAGSGVASGAYGGELWSFSGASTSPVIGSDGTVFVGNSDKRFYALNGATGETVWSVPVNAEGSPAIGEDGTIYVGSSDGNLYAISSANGTQKWKFDIGPAANCAPNLSSDGKVFVSSNTEFFALDAATGTLIWSSASFPTSSPAIGPDGTLYIGSQNVYAVNPADGSIEWSFDSFYSASTAPILGSNGLVYVGSQDGNFYALDHSSGVPVWVNSNNEPEGEPAIGADGTVYFESSSGNALALDGSTGIQKWSYDAQSLDDWPITTAPDGSVYIGHGHELGLTALDGITGLPKWAFGYGFSENDAIGADGTLYADMNGTLYAIGRSPYKLSLSTATFAGGNSVRGVVQIQNPAPPAGIMFLVTSSNNSILTFPNAYPSNPVAGSLMIPPGATGLSFAINSSTVSVSTPVQVEVRFGSDLFDQTCLFANLTVTPNSIERFYASPADILPGSTTTGVIEMAAPAGPGGCQVTLQASAQASNLTIPPSVTVPAGASTVTFPIAAAETPVSGGGPINALFAAQIIETYVEVRAKPVLSALSFTPSELQGGAGTRGVVQLAFPAGPNGVAITLQSSNPAVSVPSTVNIPAGGTGVSFAVNTSAVSTPLTVSLLASEFGVSQVSAQLVLDPLAPISGFYTAATSLTGGTSTRGVVQLAGVAGGSGLTVQLSTNSSRVTLPTAVLVPAGASGVSFELGTSPVSAPQIVTLTATSGPSSMTTRLTLTPYPISNFYLSPSTTIGASPVRGVVQLAGPAGPNGAVFSVTVNETYQGAVDAPNLVAVPSASRGVSFPVSCFAESSSYSATITVTFQSSSAQATLTVEPAEMTAFYATPASIVGGSATTGVVQFIGATSYDGAVVTLMSSNPLIQVPKSIQLPENSNGVSFAIQTKAVSTATTVQLTATWNGVSRQTTITLNPPGG